MHTSPADLLSRFLITSKTQLKVMSVCFVYRQITSRFAQLPTRGATSLQLFATIPGYSSSYHALALLCMTHVISLSILPWKKISKTQPISTCLPFTFQVLFWISFCSHLIPKILWLWILLGWWFGFLAFFFFLIIKVHYSISLHSALGANHTEARESL